MDNYQKQSRDYPAKDLPEDNLNETERSHSASIMRVNHSGEVAAQGLYIGHSIFEKNITPSNTISTLN